MGCDSGHATLVDSPHAILNLADRQEPKGDSEQATNDLTSEQSQCLRQVINELALIKVYSNRRGWVKVSFGDASKYKQQCEHAEGVRNSLGVTYDDDIGKETGA